MIDAFPGPDARPTRVDTTLAKGLQVLEALADANTAKGVTELSRELGLTKSNTFRLLQSLSALGYVRQTESKSYAPTLKAWRLGLSVIDTLDLPKVAAPFLAALAQNTGEAVYLAIREGLSVVFIDKIESTQPIRAWNPIGGGAPLHCVGTGKALLAAEYGQLRDQIGDRLIRFTDRTLITLEALDADIAATGARGYALDAGEYRENVLSFGATVDLPNGRPLASVGVSLPEVSLPAGGEAALGAETRAAAARVSEALAAL